MSSKTQHGYLLIADISGYTAFLAQTELDHAHEILSELLELIVAGLTGTFILSKLEGDAVFVYAPEDQVPQGDMVLDLIDACYMAFRDKQESMHRATTCTCAACRAIPSLDLKFFAHHGDYIVQSIGSINEIVGSDVNLLHRLMKNGLSEATGWRGYALFSEAGLTHMGVTPEPLHRQPETYEHLGTVQTLSYDLRARYNQLRETRRFVVTAAEAHYTIVVDVPAPPSVTWQWLNDPHLRMQWMSERHWSAEKRPGGRRGPGAVSHCAHGGGVLVETVLDWRPFEYYSTTSILPKSMGTVIFETTLFEPTATGTRVTYRMRGKNGLPEWLGKRILVMMVRQAGLDQFYAKIPQCVAQAQAHTPPTPEGPART